MEFKEILRVKRKERSLTQKEIAELLGLSNVSYAQYEQGKTEPSITTLKKIAEILYTTPNELLGVKNEIQKQNNFEMTLSEKESELLKYFRQLKAYQRGKLVGIARTLVKEGL